MGVGSAIDDLLFSWRWRRKADMAIADLNRIADQYGEESFEIRTCLNEIRRLDKSARFWGETDQRKLALVEIALTLGAEEKHLKRLLFSGDIRYDGNELRIMRSRVRNAAHAIVLALIPVGTLECFYVVITSPYSIGTKLSLLAIGTVVASLYLRIWSTLSVLAWWALKRTGKTLLRADHLRANTVPTWLNPSSATQCRNINAAP